MKIKNFTKITALAALLLPIKAQADDTAEVPYRPMLEEGKTWWYTMCVYDSQIGNHVVIGNDLTIELTLSGEKVIDGLTYKRLYMKSYGKGGRFEKPGEFVYYLREEDKRIYSYDLGLIYDFNLTKGQEVPWSAGGVGSKELVGERCVESQASGDFVRWTIDCEAGWYFSYWIIEGVGATSGLLNMPYTIEMDGTYSSQPPRLRWVTDKDGNVIYRESGVTKPWEITGVEYRPLIEEGKIWWYEAAVTDPETGKIRKGSFGTTLAGDTVVNGKSYKKYMMLPESRGGNPGLFVKDIDVPLALAREEDRLQYFITGPFVSNTILPIDNGDRDCFYFPTTGEYQTCQFALYPNYDYRSRFRGEPYYELWSRRVIERDGKKFVQRYDGKITVDPMEHNDYWPEDNGRNYSTEGIGWPTGLLCCPGASPVPYDIVLNEAPVLTYVTDMENNVIFEVAGGEKPWEHIGEHLRTVREDRVWNYVFYRVDGGAGTLDYLKNFSYHFEGLKKIGDNEYSIFRDQEGNEVAYMRQDGDRVFLNLLDPETGEEMHVNDRSGESLTGEITVYDFSLKKGDVFYTVGFTEGFHPQSFGIAEDFRVSDLRYIENSGFSYLCQDLAAGNEESENDKPLNSLIEGIGSLDGLLPFPMIGIVSGTMFPQYIHLESVTDGQDEVIFSNPLKNPFDNVESVLENSSLNLGYDGRRVTAQGDGDVEMTVMSLEGVAVLACSGNGVVAADVCALMPGVYVAEARCGSAVKRMKFIVK